MARKFLAATAFAVVIGASAMADDPTATTATPDGMTISVVDPELHVDGDPWLLCLTASDDLGGGPVIVTADSDTVAVFTVEPGANYVEVPDGSDAVTISTPELPGSN